MLQRARKIANSKDKTLAVVGRGAAVVHPDGRVTYQDKDLKMVDELADLFKTLHYAPHFVKAGTREYDLYRDMYTAVSGADNLELHEIGKMANEKNPIAKRFKQLAYFPRIVSLVRKCDYTLIFWPSPLAVLTFIACKLFFVKHAIYYGATWGPYGFGPVRRVVAAFLEKMVMAFSNTIFMRGKPKPHPKWRYIRGNSMFSEADLHHREDTCGANTIQLINIGHLLPRKGVKDLFKAMSLLKDKSYNLKLTHIGKYDEAEKEEYLALARELGIDGQIHFVGFISDHHKLAHYLRNSDIFVLASYVEGMPRVLNEAMSQSLPVISSETEALSGYFEHGRELLHFQPGDVDHLARLIDQVVSDGELRRRIMSGGFEKAKKEYGLPEAAEQIAQTLTTSQGRS